MSRADNLLVRLRDRGVPEAGFLYGKAVRHIIADHPQITFQALAKALGCGPAMLHKIQRGTIPNHVTGSLLWGVLWELYGDEKRRELFLSESQRRGGKLLK